PISRMQHSSPTRRSSDLVGKTEVIVAGSVSANKKWLFVSSTLLKQTVRNQLIDGEYGEDYIYILDGIVSQKRASEKHWQLIREIDRKSTRLNSSHVSSSY